MAAVFAVLAVGAAGVGVRMAAAAEDPAAAPAIQSTLESVDAEGHRHPVTLPEDYIRIADAPAAAAARPRRVGQWIMAVEQGRAAARTLLAGDGPAPPVSLLPRFWSDQNGLRIQVCGRLSDQADVHLTELRPRRRDAARAGVVAGYVEGGRLAGVAAVNAPRAFTVACRTLLSEPAVYPTPAPVAVPEPELRLRLVQ